MDQARATYLGNERWRKAKKKKRVRVATKPIITRLMRAEAKARAEAMNRSLPPCDRE
jgi:hypothetical protein